MKNPPNNYMLFIFQFPSLRTLFAQQCAEADTTLVSDHEWPDSAASDRTVPVLRCLYDELFYVCYFILYIYIYYFVAKPNQQFFANVTGVLRLNNVGAGGGWKEWRR